MAAKQGGGAESRWAKVIGEQERSGLSVGEFSRRRGLSVATLYWWRSKLSRRGRRGRGPRLMSVELLGAKDGGVPEEERAFELELAGGRRLHVPERFDADALTRLIAAVERAC